MNHTLFLTDPTLDHNGFDFYQAASNIDVLRFQLGKGKQACIAELATLGTDEFNDSLCFDII